MKRRERVNERPPLDAFAGWNSANSWRSMAPLFSMSISVTALLSSSSDVSASKPRALETDRSSETKMFPSPLAYKSNSRSEREREVINLGEEEA